MSAVAILVTGWLTTLFLSAYACHKWGFKAVAGLAIGAAFFAIVNFDFFSFVVSSLIIGSVAGFSFRTGKSFQFFLLVSTLTVTTISGLHYGYVLRTSKTDIIEESKKQWVELLGSASIDKSEAENKIALIEETSSIVKKIMPYYLFISNIVMASIGLTLLKLVLFRKKNGFIMVKGLKDFRLNDYLIFVFIASMAVVLFRINNHNSVFWFAMNFLLGMCTLYIIQAFGVIKFLLSKRNISGAVIPGSVATILLLGTNITVIAAIILSGVGALDLWADFRGLTAKPAGTSKEDI